MENSVYENQMLDVYVAKPEKVQWYKNAFSNFNINGVDKITWYWSWWAFGAGFWFFLYRKAYTYALILFVLTIVFTIVPLGGMILMIVQGGLMPYFLYKDYLDKKNKIEKTIPNEEKRIATMKEIGGYNQWVIVANIIFNIAIIGYLIVLGSAFISVLQ